MVIRKIIKVNKPNLVFKQKQITAYFKTLKVFFFFFVRDKLICIATLFYGIYQLFSPITILVVKSKKYLYHIFMTKSKIRVYLNFDYIRTMSSIQITFYANSV